MGVNWKHPFLVVNNIYDSILCRELFDILKNFTILPNLKQEYFIFIHRYDLKDKFYKMHLKSNILNNLRTFKNVSKCHR